MNSPDPAASRCPFSDPAVAAPAGGVAAHAGHRRLTHSDVGLPSHTHRRGFDALNEEQAYWIDDITGSMPAGFSGTLFRNGPGRNRVGPDRFGHWFDGDGMISRITFRDGRVHFANRYVRTPKYLDETAAQRVVHRGFGTQRPGGWLGNFLRPPANPANTGLILHGGKFLALWEGGHPWELDPTTLATTGEYDYGAVLKKLWPFSAHGKVNPVTGDYINFGIQPGPKTRINIYRISPQGEVAETGHFPLERPVFIHDFALTEHHAVFLVSSIAMRGMWKFLCGFRSLADCMAFDKNLPTRALVVDLRSMQLVMDAELPPAVFIHFGNAYEQAGQLVVEAFRYPDFSVDAALRDMANTESPDGGDLYRYVIDLEKKTVREETVPGLLQGDFPMWDWRRTGQQHRYLWSAAMANNGTQIFFNAVQKLDRETGAVQVHDFGAGRYCMEPVFMPAHAHAAEDEGYIATIVYDYRKDRSEVVLLDAADLSKTVATAALKHHLPFGFHGLFVPQTFI